MTLFRWHFPLVVTCREAVSDDAIWGRFGHSEFLPVKTWSDSNGQFCVMFMTSDTKMRVAREVASLMREIGANVWAVSLIDEDTPSLSWTLDGDAIAAKSPALSKGSFMLTAGYARFENADGTVEEYGQEPANPFRIVPNVPRETP